jgi:hypothetical protein
VLVKPGDPDYRPPRGYTKTHPPYEAGNTFGLVHGAWSQRTVDAKAAELREQMLAALNEFAPWTSDPAFLFVVEVLFDALARKRLIQTHIEQVTAEGATAKVAMRLWDMANSTDRLILETCDRLGLAPEAKARLTKVTADSKSAELGLTALIEKGRQTKAGRAIEAASKPTRRPRARKSTEQ